VREPIMRQCMLVEALADDLEIMGAAVEHHVKRRL
jgi:hypothetical protein